MFADRSDSGYVPALEGVHRKTLAYGEKTLMTEFRLRKGAVLPRHAHAHEQTGYLVSGQMRMQIGREEFDVLPGASWCIPGNVEHGAVSVEDSIAIEVFCPLREDYLPSNRG